MLTDPVSVAGVVVGSRKT